jgi:hypothetical protein
LTKIIPVTIAAFMVVLIIKFHKKRKREDVLPNEHVCRAVLLGTVETKNDYYG